MVGLGVWLIGLGICNFLLDMKYGLHGFSGATILGSGFGRQEFRIF